MAILKTSADTNAGQNDRLTHCIKKSTLLQSKIYLSTLYFSYIPSKIQRLLKTFFLVSQSLTNAISLSLIYSISSKHVSEFSAPPPPPKKTDTSGSIFPITPKLRSNPHPPGRPCKSNSLPPGHRKGSNVRGLAAGGGGGGDVEVSL